MRRLLPLALVAAAGAGCGSSAPRTAAPATATRTAPSVLVHVDLGAAARKLLRAGSAHVVYDLRVEPPRPSPLQFVTHAVGDYDFARGNASYVASTPAGEAAQTVVVGNRRWTRGLGGGTAGAGNPGTGWHRVRGPDRSPAGAAGLVPLAAEGARGVHRIGTREYETRVVVTRTPASLHGYLEGVFGGPSGLARFSLDRRGRIVSVALLNPTLLAGRTLVYAYTYSRLGEPVRIRPPVR